MTDMCYSGAKNLYRSSPFHFLTGWGRQPKKIPRFPGAVGSQPSFDQVIQSLRAYSRSVRHNLPFFSKYTTSFILNHFNCFITVYVFSCSHTFELA